MPEFIRVKNRNTGAEFTIAGSAIVGGDVEVLDKPAVDEHSGKPLPPKYKTSLTPDATGDSEPNIPAAPTPASPKKESK